MRDAMSGAEMRVRWWGAVGSDYGNSMAGVIDVMEARSL